MLSLSDNEFAVLNYLVRNFRERLTVRAISKKLGFSSAGVYVILKKLEEAQIVVGEKLGTGLFYRMNLENKAAYYFACAVLVEFYHHTLPIADMASKAAIALFNGKELLLIADAAAIGSDITIPQVKTVVVTVTAFTDALRKKDAATLKLLQTSNVLFGEQKLLEIIRPFIEHY